MRRTHWFGEDVETIDTTLDELPAHLPVFDRYPLGANRFHDLIARRATGDGRALPIDVVSKKYVLVQHADPIRAVSAQVRKAGINPTQMPARLMISEYGTRIAVRATLPKRYEFKADDGHSLGLTFECFNSVDGSVPLFAAVGWFRFVCSNGLVVGTTSAKVRQRHLPPLQIDQISEVLADGMGGLADRNSFQAWRGRRWRVPISRDGSMDPSPGVAARSRARRDLDDRPRRRAGARPDAPPHQSVVLTDGFEVPGTRTLRGRLRNRAGLAWVAARQHDGAPAVAGRFEDDSSLFSEPD